MEKLKSDDMDKVAGGKGEYKVKPVDGGFEVTKIFENENEAIEYANKRNEMHKSHCHGPGCGDHPHKHHRP